ncbi:MAG: DUF547 domain-containing protein, partial [Winogradskyella sp.]|nr:DUF547 domain-containing protein [Winogradskyella sp.]
TATACFSSKGIDVKSVSNQTYEKSKDAIKVDHRAWDDLLKKHVKPNGLVDYKGFINDSVALNQYINYLSQQVPDKTWSVKEQLAYFINVYNANTIKLIGDNYPVPSIKDVSATISPFLKQFIKIGDKSYSLADIEKGILQKMNEPRIHFAINCASISCPKLLQTAFTAKNVDELMDIAASEFINSDKNKLSANNPKLSEIFKWYKSDFLQISPSIIDYINQYADVQINANAELNYIQYNWDLNDTN